MKDDQKPKLTIHLSGNQDWTIGDRVYHREDGPAIEYSDGTKVWRFNGKHHRTDGPAVEDCDGNKIWWIDGKRHRIGGPAVEYADGSSEWYVNGKLHREDGPAIEYLEIEGEPPCNEYWLNGIQYSFDEWNKLRKMTWML